MKNTAIKISILVTLFLSFVGCETIKDFPKIIIGNSTRHLEKARTEAISKTYLCSFDECFDAVLSLGSNDEESVSDSNKPYVFSKDRIESYIVFMKIEGSVDTTEVGVFFSPYGKNAYTIDIASLSTSAKNKAAELIFKYLETRFEEVK